VSSIHISLVTPPATNGPRPADARVHLEEVKVFAQLNGDGPSNDTLWYLDMGVTNQMIGLRAVFSELVGGVVGTKRFGDGSCVLEMDRFSTIRAAGYGPIRVQDR